MDLPMRRRTVSRPATIISSPESARSMTASSSGKPLTFSTKAPRATARACTRASSVPLKKMARRTADFRDRSSARETPSPSGRSTSKIPIETILRHVALLRSSPPGKRRDHDGGGDERRRARASLRLPRGGVVYPLSRDRVSRDCTQSQPPRGRTICGFGFCTCSCASFLTLCIPRIPPCPTAHDAAQSVTFARFLPS